MANRTAERVSITGLGATYHAAEAGGDTVPPGSVVHVKNTSTAAITVTAVTPGTVVGQPIGDPSVSVPATSGERFFGPFERSHFAAPNGTVALTWSAAAGVTFAVLEV